jgi:hypothetical protein
MFQKLNLSLSEIDIANIKGASEYDSPTFKQFSISDKQYLIDLLSSKIRFAVPPHEANITEILYPGVRPHTDSWPTAINFYLNSSNDETCFWEEINSTDVTKKTGPTPFNNFENLKNIGSFTANTGDCYLLNVGSIHSVKMNIPNTKRQILRLSWYKFNFNQILHSFKILNG